MAVTQYQHFQKEMSEKTHPYLLDNPDAVRVPYSVLTHLTPAMASEMLATAAERALSGGRVNRDTREAHVRKLAGAMTRGEWEVGDGGIGYDSNGDLIQGKHRLASVVLSGVAIWIWVVYDLKPVLAQRGMDTGATRNLKDILQIERKEKDAGALATVIATKWRWDRGDYRTDAKPSTPQGLAVLDAHPRLRDVVVMARRKVTKFHISQSVIAVCWYDFSLLHDDADDFFARLSDGVGLEQGSPILCLRRHVEGPHGRKQADKVMLHALTVKAWNLWQDGTPCDRLRWSIGGANPEPFPVPH